MANNLSLLTYPPVQGSNTTSVIHTVLLSIGTQFHKDIISFFVTYNDL